VNRRTTGIIFAVVGVVIVLIAVLSVRQVIVTRLTPAEQPAVPTPAAVEEVVVTTHDVESGRVLQEEDLKRVEVPVEAVAWGAIQEIENVVGRLTKVDLVSGEMVLNHHLADPTNVSHDIGYFIDEDQVLMAFPSSGLMSSLNIFERGDLVDLLVSMEQVVRVEEISEDTGEPVIADQDEEEQEQTRFVTFDAMQAIELQAVIVDVSYEEESQEAAVPLGSIQGQGGQEGEGEEGEEGEEEGGEEGAQQATPGRRPSSVNVRAYLLAVHPQDALVLKHLLDSGAQFDMVLRAPNNDRQFDLQPVVPDYLIDRFGLEVRE